MLMFSCWVVVGYCVFFFLFGFFFQAEDGIRDLVRSRGLGDVYKRQALACRGNGIQIESTDDGTLLPQSFSLLPPYPNPFNPVSYTHLTLPTSDLV